MKKYILFLSLLLCSSAIAQTLTPDAVLIEQIKGEKGDKGDAGYTPVKGVDYFDGKDGKDGLNGTGVVNSGFWRDVASWNELAVAFNDAEQGIVRNIRITANLTATNRIRLPHLYKAGLTVYGGNGEIKKGGAIDTMFYRHYATITEGKKNNDFRLHWIETSFYGQNTGVCFFLSTTYESFFDRCYFYQFNVAVDIRWALQTTFYQCRFYENYIGINSTFDKASPAMAGGNNTDSQSNHVEVNNCNFRTVPGNFASIKSVGCSGLIVWHCIFEGGEQGTGIGSDYAVYFDDNGSTVVKDVNILFSHGEYVPAIAAFYIKLKDGIATVHGSFKQKKGTLVKFESSAYGKMIVSNVPYIPGESKFESIGSGGRWKFIDMPATFDPYVATTWTGAIPAQTYYEGHSTNGQAPFIKMNGKQVLKEQ